MRCRGLVPRQGLMNYWLLAVHVAQVLQLGEQVIREESLPTPKARHGAVPWTKQSEMIVPGYVLQVLYNITR
jgi:hypothetical protein